MNRLVISIFCSMAILLISACGQSEDELIKSKYLELSWEQLQPLDEQPVRHGSLEIVEDRYTDGFDQEFDIGSMYSGFPPPAHSVGVVSEFDGKNIRVPGFVVPTEFGAGNLVTEFFLVPYFGACFHMPPPAPNQTIYVSSDTPIEYESIYDPVWIMGVINTEQTTSDIATAAYRMNLHFIQPFTE